MSTPYHMFLFVSLFGYLFFVEDESTVVQKRKKSYNKLHMEELLTQPSQAQLVTDTLEGFLHVCQGAKNYSIYFIGKP